MIVDTHEIDYKRQITVYVPAQYKRGSEAPFMVSHDGPKGKPNMGLPRILDNLIAQERIPPIILIQIANGGVTPRGHQRGKEYDNMSGLFAKYIETEVLPRVEKHCKVKLTKKSRRPCSDGIEFRRFGSTHHGLVPHRSLPARAHHLGNIRQPGVAIRSQVP
ncbi:MAG: hypothetical protein Ct9H300mP1_22900 [Planctomycetaceae bacterium]|nr:MAG: hypothetical protein Ct9H300mP1_22900 [Planctomycetaceae bacterium]